MKRHAAIAPLSREHHHALVIARCLREATPATATEQATRFLEHWQREERLHFRLEEEILLPAYAAHASPEHELITRTLIEHILIRRDAHALTVRQPVDLLHRLGALLEAHVRLEERQLFPLIESALDEQQLRELGERLEQGRQAASGRD